MKFPYSWLKELVPQLPPVTELEPIFAGLGTPLEGTETVPGWTSRTTSKRFHLWQIGPLPCRSAFMNWAVW